MSVRKSARVHRRVILLENCRAVLRRLLSKRAYAMIAMGINAAEVLRRQGPLALLGVYGPPKPGEVERRISLKGYAFPIFFRPGTTDVNTLVQNLVRDEYGAFFEKTQPRLLIDGGAYIGDVSLYFLNRFPNCRVVAIEPDTKNFRLAERNLSPYGDRITLIQGALWKTEGTISLNGEFVSASVKRNGDAETVKNVSCRTMAELLEMVGEQRIDIVKLDIEGAEHDVICDENGWLERTDRLIVEYHGETIERECDVILREKGFEGKRYRSLMYYTRKKSLC